MVRIAPGAAALVAALMMAGCATPPSDPVARAAFDEANDPIEPFNRSMFTLNATLDRYMLRPVAATYHDVVPDVLRVSLRDFLRNLRSPLILIHDLAQGEGGRAATTLQRFLANSTLGIAGFMDVSGEYFGLPFHDEDAGQTLAVWGVPEGPYVVLPLLGPSSARDTGGFVVDNVIDPVSLAMQLNGITYGPIVRAGLTVLDERARLIGTLDDLERGSIDFYATLRSLYRQRRAKEIANGREVAGDQPTIEAPGRPAGAVEEIAPPPVAKPQSPAVAAPVPVATMPAAAAVPSSPPPTAMPAAAPMAERPAMGELRGAVLLFADGSALLSEQDRRVLRQIAETALASRAEVRIVGHAREQSAGTDPARARYVNFEVAGDRADAVAATLAAYGMPADRMTVESSGDADFRYLLGTPRRISESRSVEVLLQ